MISPVGASNSWNQVERTNRTIRPMPDWYRAPSFNHTPWRLGNQPNNFADTPAIQNLGTMRSQATSLQSAIQDLRRPDTFNRQTITSSNTTALAITAQGNQSAAFNPAQVTIQQIAAGQENRGTGMSATALSGLGGTHTFEVEIDGRVHQLSFNASMVDNNRTVQQRMADAINSANIGVTASIVADPESGTNALNLAAQATGNAAAASFAIRDTGESTIVSRMGVGAATRDAQQAIFTVNGEERRTDGNTVLIGGATATLRAPTTEAVTVERTTDINFGMDRVRDMVASFNSLMDVARNNANVNPRLQQDLEGVLRSFGPGLRNLGIDINNEGRMVINQERFEAAAQRPEGGGQSRMESFFREFGSHSFADRVGNITTRALTQPQQYAVRPPAGDLGQWDPGQADMFSLFAGRGNMMARFNQQLNLGMLLDMFI
ncbi:MAG: hypothetical protein FWE32_00210 [Oscillospiraceae bacterium]|nr:hypothetical protein [Oscillospiraceae bacterium]